MLMDNQSLSDGIRRFAFQKLAALAVKAPARDGDGSELARLAEQSQSTSEPNGDLNGVLRQQAPTSQIPMVRHFLAARPR
jgi:phosphatidylinositol 4-kinase